MEDPKFYQDLNSEERRKKMRQMEEETLLEQQVNVRRIKAMQSGGGVAGSSKLVPGGVNGSIQYNNNGTLGGNPNFTIEFSPETFSTSRSSAGFVPKITLNGNIEIVGKINGATVDAAIEIDYETLRGPDPGQPFNPNQPLIPGQIYAITGFNKNMPYNSNLNPCNALPEVLYDDGTNSGITIYVEAITTERFSDRGFGLFYDPIYANHDDYISGTNTTRLYGIWDGDNPEPVSPITYSVNDYLFWGGYAWRNKTGQVGTNVDVLNLDSTNWEKISYSAGVTLGLYRPALDEIRVDWQHGIIIERYNAANQIRVAFNVDTYSTSLYSSLPASNLAKRNPISVIPWGLYSQYADCLNPTSVALVNYGISNIESINSYVDLINFKGRFFKNSVCYNSLISANYFGENAIVEQCHLKNSSSLSGNVLLNSSSMFNLKLSYNSSIWTNTLRNSFINDNFLSMGSSINTTQLNDGSKISNNTLLDNSTIWWNNLYLSSSISDNKFKDYGEIGVCFMNGENGRISNNVFLRYSVFQSCALYQNCSISNNQFNAVMFWQCSLRDESKIEFNEFYGPTISWPPVDPLMTGILDFSWLWLQNGSQFVYNRMGPNSAISHGFFDNTVIEKCVFTNSCWQVSGTAILSQNQIVNKIMKDTEIHGTLIALNMSNATVLFNDAKKWVFTRDDGTIRIMYYNNSDTPVYANIDA